MSFMATPVSAVNRAPTRSIIPFAAPVPPMRKVSLAAVWLWQDIAAAIAQTARRLLVRPSICSTSTFGTAVHNRAAKYKFRLNKHGYMRELTRNL